MNCIIIMKTKPYSRSDDAKTLSYECVIHDFYVSVHYLKKNNPESMDLIHRRIRERLREKCLHKEETDEGNSDKEAEKSVSHSVYNEDPKNVY